MNKQKTNFSKGRDRFLRFAIPLIVLIVALTLGAVMVLAAAGTEIDMTIADSEVSYNDAIFIQGPLDVNSAGTGVIDPFLSVGGGGNQAITKGYNTIDASAEFDTVTGGDRTRPLLLSGVPEVEIGGEFYREFKLDINKTRGQNEFMALSELKLFLTDDPTITSYDHAGGTEFGADATKVWDLGDAVVLMNYALESGSGASDVSFFVKSSVFSTTEDCSYGSSDCTTYLVMWNEYGNYSDSALYPDRTWEDNDGFEEWGIVLRPVVEAEKSAQGTYDRTITWELDKSVAPGSHSGKPGDTFDSTWEVEVTKNVVDSNILASGTITIFNPTGSVFSPVPDDVPAEILSINDVIDQAGLTTNAPVECGVSFPYTLGGGETLECTYEVSTPNTNAGFNTATIEVEVPQQIGGGTDTYDAVADLSFTGNVTGDESVTVDDNRDDEGNFPANISSSTTFDYDETFECSSNPGDYTNGVDEDTYLNTATATGNNTNLSDDATVTVTCSLDALEPSKTAAGTYDRTVIWELDKSVTPGSHSGKPGDTFDSTWTVVVTKSEVSDNYKVTGSISINNPASIDQTFSVSDVLNDGTSATVVCPSNTVAAGATVVCTYTAVPGDDSATLNTATVSAAGNPDQTATAGVSFTENLIGDESVTVDDNRDTEGQFPANISSSTTFDYDETFECSSNPGDYTNGVDEDTYPNTATATGDNTNLSDDASVTVTCSLDALVPSKTAAGSYDRTVTWTLDKSVAPASHSGYPGDTFDSTWTVVATKSEVSDNYKVTGSISINNPASIDQTFSVSDVLNDGTSATVVCPSNTVAAGATVVCTYTAVPGDDSATLNTATVSAAGNADQTATAGVSFIENLIGDDSVTVDDDRDTEGQFPANISSSTTFDYDETFVCSTDWADYTSGVDEDTYPNTATATGNNTNLSDNASVTVTCEAGTIDVQKYTDGVINGAYDWQFALYIGPDGFDGTQVGNTSSSLGDADGILDFGDPVPALRPDTTYSVCELGVAAGWATNWSIDGVTVIPYNPNSDENPAQDLGNDCFDVGDGTSYPVTVGQNLRITVDNTFPGGDPRTPGYWKNWSSCSNGGQYAKTTDDVDPENEFVSLDEVLNSPGVSWGDFTIDSCELAVSILDQRDFDTGRKMASDAAYTLAMHLLAAQLNYGAGAEQCSAASDAIVAGETLLVGLGFDGTGKYLRPNKAEYQTALELAATLDQYNNGNLCQ